MNVKFLDFIKKYKDKRVALAVSGGVDSVALMHWYAIACEPSSPVVDSVVILHVNHGLRPEAGEESEYVKKSAEKLGLHCEILRWDGQKPTAGLEAAAREARYDLMLDWCKKNDVSVLMTAHQADDQIETFLMNLGRGSGIYGLGGIRPESNRNGIIIARPLLEVPREELKNWCENNEVKYFSDSMNDDERFTRVKVRKNRHFLREKLGISDQRILTSIANISRAREQMESALEGIFSSCQEPSAGGSEASRLVLSADALFKNPMELQLKFLGEALRRISGAEYTPRLKDILRLHDRLQNDTVATLSHCAIRRLGPRILITREGESLSFRNTK